MTDPYGIQRRQRRGRAGRPTPIAVLLLLAVLFGFLYEGVCTVIEHKNHPRQFSQAVETYAAAYSVPEEVVYATIKAESDFASNAVSPKGAVGLMQLMPDTFLWLGELLGESPAPGLLYEPETNIRYGTYYLSWLYARYGDWQTVSAAYNAGPGRVDAWLDDPALGEDGKLVSIPYKETARYVKRVQKAAAVYARLYGEV